MWPIAQYTFALNSGIEDKYRQALPSSVVPIQDYVFPASCVPPVGRFLSATALIGASLPAPGQRGEKYNT